MSALSLQFVQDMEAKAEPSQLELDLLYAGSNLGAINDHKRELVKQPPKHFAVEVLEAKKFGTFVLSLQRFYGLMQRS
jgi:hypothetical protein